MMETKAAAYAVYPRHVPLFDVAKTLNQAGFDNKEICIVLSPAHPVAQVVREANVLERERESLAVTARMIGRVSELGACVIPSVGFFVRSQKFLQALITDHESSSPTVKSKTLASLGFSNEDVERLDHQICERIGALIYVSCQEDTRTDRAIELLRNAGAWEAASMPQKQHAAAA
jgi:hypothetical protein